ncbi:MAG: DUF697 domain-containing protein [Planctomycetota bacterium]|jgi:uncharacterized membrane protein YcjF (UPF0283 family)|nr:DUF697 domain-containing protein [Planctomycetota bacterium]
MSSKPLDISPNIPDIAPDYADAGARPGKSGTERRPAPTGGMPAAARLESALFLNAEILARPEPAVAAAPAHRNGECVPNVPDAPPDIVDAPPIAEVAPPAASGPLPAEPRRSWLRWDVFAVPLILSLFGLLVFSQALNALAVASALPAWAGYLLLIPMGLCCLVILFVCAGVVAAWFKLRAVRQVDLEALDDLRRRAESRRDSIAGFKAARTEVENYLKNYSLAEDGVQRLREAGLAGDAAETLARERERLLGKVADSRSWLADFQDGFQAALDGNARSRIRHWSMLAAGCAVASPIPLLDAALILAVALKMIGDLCRIYNVRGGRSVGLVLLNRAILAAFIAGAAQDAANALAGAAGDEFAGLFGETALADLGAAVGRAVAPKLGEGAANALFINRLGKTAMRLLQPVRTK